MKFFVPIIYTKNNDERKQIQKLQRDPISREKIWGRGIKTEEQRRRCITHHRRIYPCDSGVLELSKPEANSPVLKKAEITRIIKVMVQPAPPKRASCIFQKTRTTSIGRRAHTT
jgi:hypothetical protein